MQSDKRASFLHPADVVGERFRLVAHIYYASGKEVKLGPLRLSEISPMLNHVKWRRVNFLQPVKDDLKIVPFGEQISYPCVRGFQSESAQKFRGGGGLGQT